MTAFGRRSIESHHNATSFLQIKAAPSGIGFATNVDAYGTSKEL